MQMKIIYRREDVLNLIVEDIKKRMNMPVIPQLTVEVVLTERNAKNELRPMSPNDVIENYVAMADTLNADAGVKTFTENRKVGVNVK